MNIAIVCPNYPPASFEGGISHYSARLAESLLLRGHNVYAFASTTFSQPVADLNESNGVEIIRIKGPWNHHSIGKIRDAAIDYRIDALILQYAPADFKKSFRISWALRRLSCQKITAFHTLWGKGFDRVFGLLILWGSSKIVVTNSEISTILKKRLPVFLKKAYPIPIASSIDPNPRFARRDQSAIPLISFFGMLYPGKGLYLILDVLEELKRRGLRFVFKFIGGGIAYHKAYAAEFQNEIKKRKLHGVVETLGQLPAKEVSTWLSQSSFVFLPFESGLSDRRSSFMTALVHGKAILTSPPVVTMPLFKNGVNVLWPDVPTLPEYVRLVEQLLKNDKLVHRLESGVAKLSQAFNWKKIAEDYESALGFAKK